MRHIKLLSVTAIAVIALCFAWVGVTRAQQFSPNVSAKQTVNSSVFSAAKTVNIDGTINGDVYCAGQDVTITGIVHGDVICAGQKVLVSGTVDGSVRVAGQRVEFTGKAGRGVSIAGQEVTIDRRATIGQDAVIAGSTLDINGLIKRDAIISGSDAKLSGVVQRNVRFSGAQLSLESGAAISGGLTYTSNRAVSVANDANVKGATVREAKQVKEQRGAHIFGRSILGALAIVVSFVVFSLFLVWFFPQQLHKVSQVAVDSLGKTVLIGFAALFVVPFVFSVLVATLLGIPLAALFLLAALTVAALSTPVAAYYFGSMVWSKQHNPVKVMLAGSAIVSIAFLFPIIGALFTFIAYLIGSGALILYVIRHWPKPKYKV